MPFQLELSGETPITAVYGRPLRYTHAINEVELTFVTTAYAVEVILEFDKGGGMFSSGHDSFGRYTVDHRQSHAGYGAPGYGHAGGMGGVAMGVAGGLAAGYVAGEVLDEVFEDDEEEAED